MLARPRRALGYLAAAGSTEPIHISEHALRLLAGAAFFLSAGAMRYPLLFELFGAFLVASSAIVLVLPRRWHHLYALWWANRLSPAAVRCLSPVSITVGGFIFYAAG